MLVRKSERHIIIGNVVRRINLKKKVFEINSAHCIPDNYVALTFRPLPPLHPSGFFTKVYHTSVDFYILRGLIEGVSSSAFRRFDAIVHR